MSSSSSSDISSPAFAPLTGDDHGSLVIVASYIFLIVSLLAVVVKIWTRIQTTRKLVWNDHFMLLASILAIAQTISLTLSVNYGLGKHIRNVEPANLSGMSKAYYASNILLISALAGAKASITLLIISIKPAQNVRYACYGTLGFIGAWTIACIFALAFQCSVPTPWTLGPSTCVNQYALQIGIGITNILSDFAIIALPFFMMRSVQVAAQKRWIVIALFALRIIVPVFTILALVTYNTYYNSTPQDRTWHLVAPTLWTQAMLNASIITACIPSIKRFLADIQSGLMGAGISEYYEHTHSGGKGATYGSQSYGRGTGLGSKLAVRLGITSTTGGSGMRSRNEKESRLGNEQDMDLEDMRRQNHNGKGSRETTESVKGLTTSDDVIVQTIDYKVEYEDAATEESEGGRSSRDREHGLGMGMPMGLGERNGGGVVHAIGSYGSSSQQAQRNTKR